MSLRNTQPDGAKQPTSGEARLNLLLSHGGWREDDPLRQLPRLLDPLGICSMFAGSGDEAAELIEHHPIHIAVVDLEIPFDRNCPQAKPGGPRILHPRRHGFQNDDGGVQAPSRASSSRSR